MPHTSKGLLDIDHFPRRSLHEAAASRPGPLPASLAADYSCVLEIAFVTSNDHDRRYAPAFFSLASYSCTFLSE